MVWELLLNALKGILKKTGIGVTVPINDTGFVNMRDTQRLIATQDLIWNSKAYMPKETDGEEVTYCNLAVQAVFAAFGYHGLDTMRADEIMLFVRSSPLFLVKPLLGIQELVNNGTIIVAGLTGAELGQSHGHVATLTPGPEDYSGHWGVRVPVCLSIGRKGICFRTKGVNWAFVPPPTFYAWRPSL